MPYLSMAEVRRVAENLGHANLEISRTPTGRSWFATCSCGYRSVNKRTAALAAGSAVHHLDLVARAAYASGRSLPAAIDVEKTG